MATKGVQPNMSLLLSKIGVGKAHVLLHPLELGMEISNPGAVQEYTGCCQQDSEPYGCVPYFQRLKLCVL